MKGIVRNLDHLGRVTLPIDYRRSFGISTGENAPIGIYIKDNVICLHMKKEKFIGVVRELDGLGRICLPKEFRKSLKIEDCDLIDMWIENDEICLRKATLQCVICGSEKESELLEVDSVLVCRSCGTKIVNRLKEELAGE